MMSRNKQKKPSKILDSLNLSLTPRKKFRHKPA